MESSMNITFENKVALVTGSIRFRSRDSEGIC
jgi:hypothetical protein